MGQNPTAARDHSLDVVHLHGQGDTQLHDRQVGWNLACMTAPQLTAFFGDRPGQ